MPSVPLTSLAPSSSFLFVVVCRCCLSLLAFVATCYGGPTSTREIPPGEQRPKATATQRSRGDSSEEAQQPLPALRRLLRVARACEREREREREREFALRTKAAVFFFFSFFCVGTRYSVFAWKRISSASCHQVQVHANLSSSLFLYVLFCVFSWRV